MFVIGPVFNYAYNWASSHGGLCVNADYSPEINPIYVEIQSLSECTIQYNKLQYNPGLSGAPISIERTQQGFVIFFIFSSPEIIVNKKLMC